MENILTRPSKICEEGFQPNDNVNNNKKASLITTRRC